MAKPEVIEQVQRKLNANGYPCGKPDGVQGPRTRRAILAFQYAFRGGWDDFGPLARVGHLNVQTRDAILDGLPRLSPNFRAREFGCRHCGQAYVMRHLVQALEEYRHALGGPVSIVSGYRCPVHNRNVGGATNSQHMYGRAADVPAQLSVAEVRKIGRFTGIGYNASSGRVAHVDVRPGGLAVWRYGR